MGRATIFCLIIGHPAYDQDHVGEGGRLDCVVSTGNFGSWIHQINVLRNIKISQNEISAADHLVGARWGIFKVNKR